MSGKRPTRTVSALLYAIKHHDELERARAVAELARHGQEAYRALEEIITTLEDGSEGVRHTAHNALLSLDCAGLEVRERLLDRVTKMAAHDHARAAIYAQTLEVIELHRVQNGDDR